MEQFERKQMKTKIETTNNLKFTTTRLAKGDTLKIKLKIRLNDECQNGHEDFATMAYIYEKDRHGIFRRSMSGCCHDEILEHFPEFAPFVALHLCDWEGAPMYATTNGFHWFQGFVPESVDYSPNLGACHGGTGSGAKSPAECKRVLMESFRATEADISAMIDARPRTKQEFAHIIEELGFRARWKAEAKNAIKQLEKLTGAKFKSTATRSHWKPLNKAQIAEIKKRRTSGYYDPEKVAARDAAKLEAVRLARIAKVKNDYAQDVAKLATPHPSTRCQPTYVPRIIPPIVAEMISSVANAAEVLRGRISNVKHSIYNPEMRGEGVTFDLDGQPWHGCLKGRNADLMLGHSKETDAAIACRVLLDGDATPAK